MENVIPFPVLTEIDIQNLFQKPGYPTFKSYLFYTIYFVVVFGLCFIVLNFSSFSKIISFKRSSDVVVQNKNNLPKIELNPIVNNSPQKTADDQKQNQIQVEPNQLYIAGLDIRVPINWETNFIERDILNSLQTGVVHLKGTSRPGEIGNIFISGHSSYFAWNKGQYKNIFSTLGKIKLADKAYINYQNKIYTYEVKDVFEVTPDKIEVIGGTDKFELTLSTCTPPGTATRRLIVKLVQIDPDSANNIRFKGEPINLSGQIPAS